MTHRPLSAWTARLEPGSTQPGPVNDGHHRCDAREIPSFAQGWRRVTVPVGPDVHALGLTNQDGTTVVELDDFGSPIAVSPDALPVIDLIELRWPAVDELSFPKLAVLRDQPLALRYWLLERMDNECDPPDSVFAILPWNLLDRAVDSVVAGLEPHGELGELVEIRHWLTPAVRGLTGPLEQLDHGLRTGDARIARLGASALLRSIVQGIPVARIPQPSRANLNRLVTALGKVDPLFRHMSRVASARLTEEQDVPAVRGRLNPELEAAANRENDVRQRSEVIGDDDQWIRIDTAQSGIAQLTVHVVQGVTTDSPLGTLNGWFLPIRITPPDDSGGTGYWIALYPEGNELIGSIDIALPKGESRFDADSAPVGVDDLEFVDPIALLASIQASTAISQRRWFMAADTVPDYHPVRVAVNMHRDSPQP